MSYQALARKYRPQSFRDTVGQETVVQTLQNAIRDERIHHAYLFSGVRGVGKTTLARILAKALNCQKGPAAEPCNECTTCREITEGIDMDVREIDAATYTGVDNVRELRDVSQFQPARDRYRIFIIDEAHMLSTASWNALLKLIEEPPPHVMFMFATTEMHKVPQTIISRVQKEILRKITLEDLIGHLKKVCAAEGIKADPKALEIVARRGEGSVRDSLSLLDQIIAFSGRKITVEDVATVLGLSDISFFARIVGLIGEGDHGGVLDALQEASSSGRDFKMLYRDLLNFVRNLLLIAGGANESMLAVSPEDLPSIQALSETFSYTELLRIANLLLRDDETVNRAEHQRLAVEIALLKAATFPRLKSVEQALAGGGQAILPVQSPAAKPKPRREETQASPHREDAPAAPRREEAQSASPREERQAGSPVPHQSSNSDDFVAAFKKKRPLLGPYLESATVEKTGNRIVLTFTDKFAADAVSDAKDSLQEIASQVYGEACNVDVRLHQPEPVASGRRTEDKPPSTLRDDPVLGAFRKHLGGELIKESK